jgi:hypothetical protein
VIRWLRDWWKTRRLRKFYIKVAREHFCKLGFRMEQSSDRIVLMAALDLAVHWLPVVVAAAQTGETLMVSPVFPVNPKIKETPAVLH